ncbi:MAG: hypothetical protein EXS14_08545 [Planctomycetes bacterium]|nr:hypothetical protein [Planctomycetota bacterium]
MVRDQEVGGSNPLAPTSQRKRPSLNAGAFRVLLDGAAFAARRRVCAFSGRDGPRPQSLCSHWLRAAGEDYAFRLGGLERNAPPPPDRTPPALTLWNATALRASARSRAATAKLAPVIDRTYSLSKAPEALRYLEAGHTRGKVVIVVGK